MAAVLLHKQLCQHKAGGASKTAMNHLSSLCSKPLLRLLSGTLWFALSARPKKGLPVLMMMMMIHFPLVSLVSSVVLAGPGHAIEAVQRTKSAKNVKVPET